ncbi:hypothetical protein Lal_00018814 [Lupinus albus]|nr:hypothetical protein Lal_00018814 [Lupinus albus]
MVGMRKDPKVGGGIGGTCEVTKNQTQHSPSDFGSINVANFGSSNVANFGSSNVASFGSSDVASFGSSDVTSFGSSDVTRFGSSDVARFGSSDFNKRRINPIAYVKTRDHIISQVTRFRCEPWDSSVLDEMTQCFKYHIKYGSITQWWIGHVWGRLIKAHERKIDQMNVNLIHRLKVIKKNHR